MDNSGKKRRRNFFKIAGATLVLLMAGAVALGLGLNLKLREADAQTHAASSYVPSTKGIFKHIPWGERGLEEVYDWVDHFVTMNKRIAEKKIIGKSYPGNIDVPAVFITNRDIPDKDKQVAIITLTRHGQEVGTRVTAPEILNYLASDDAKKIRDTQLVIVVPVVNPEGFIQNKFNSLLTGLTKNERRVLGPFFSKYIPDVIMDYHSLGRWEGSFYDHGDMSVIVPANTTKWGMDEQIHQYLAHKMVDAAENAGYPYEIHTLEDIYCYYFGGRNIGNAAWTPIKEKTYLLTTQSPYDGYDAPFLDDVQPEKRLQPVKGYSGYTNYTNGPAYRKWHPVVFGIETNHWSMTDAGDIAVSGLMPAKELLKIGSSRLSWEKDRGYPTNIVRGDFRMSIRSIGENDAERRASRIRLWGEKMNFDIPQREMMPDRETTIARLRYFGNDLPLEFAYCLRMRQKPIKSVTLGGKKLKFETFEDKCSTFLYIPLVVEKAGTIVLEIKHGKGNAATKG